MWSLTGGGDWRTLLRVAKSAVWVVEGTVSVGVGMFGTEGDRLWRFMYEAEEWLRGSCGRPVTGDRGTSLSQMDELRLTAGLIDLEDAGDCWEGGV
jgi:hypothetical protein